MNQIDYSKLSLENGILSIDTDNNLVLLDSAYSEYMKAIDQWYNEYKEQYLSDSPTDTTDIEVKMKDIIWFYVSDVFSSHFPGFKSLQNRYKELENMWLQSNMENDELDPWNIVVKDKLERMVLNSESEVIFAGEFIKVYDDGTNIKLKDFTKEDIALLKDKSNVELVAGKNRTAQIDYRSDCDYWEENKQRYDYSLCDDNYRFIYEAGVYNGLIITSIDITKSDYFSQYWGDAGLYRRNWLGGIAWRVKADWMDDVLSGTVYLYPTRQPAEWRDHFTREERYPECTCLLHVQTGIIDNCPGIENDIQILGNYWPTGVWKGHCTDCNQIEVKNRWGYWDPVHSSALKVAVKDYHQFSATFGFKHTHIKRSFWTGRVKCKETKIRTGLKISVK